MVEIHEGSAAPERTVRANGIREYDSFINVPTVAERTRVVRMSGHDDHGGGHDTPAPAHGGGGVLNHPVARAVKHGTYHAPGYWHNIFSALFIDAIPAFKRGFNYGVNVLAGDRKPGPHPYFLGNIWKGVMELTAGTVSGVVGYGLNVGRAVFGRPNRFAHPAPAAHH